MPILKKALAKNLPDRYQTALEFAVDLREWLKAHATTTSSQNVLEALVDLEAPTQAPMPTGAETSATVDIGTGRRPTTPVRKGTVAPTRAGAGRTVVEPGVAGTQRPGPTRVMTTPAARTSPRVQRQERPSVLPWIAMALALVAVGVAGYLAWKSQQAPPAPVAVAPPTTAPPPPTTVATPPPPPVTAAPAPDFGEAGGKAAAQVKLAQQAFEAGNYDKALAAAQAALREDAASEPAKRILAQAMLGQKAGDQVRSGDAALARGDVGAAETAAAEALRIAPWDDRAVALQRRIAEARARGQRDAEASAAAQRAAQVNAALNEASTALQAKQYEAAIAAYDRALAIDPNSQPAQTGKQAAIGAKSLADAAASGPRAGAATVKSFVAGRTDAKAARGRRPRRLRGLGRCHGEVGHAGRGAAGHDRVRRGAAGAEGRRLVQDLRVPVERGRPADPAHRDDRHHHRRRPAAEGTAAPRHGHRGPRPAWPRVPDAFGHGVAGQHAVVVDGDRADHAAW